MNNYDKYSIYELRTLGREIGIKNPTTMRKSTNRKY